MNDTHILSSGMYNLGFIGLGAGTDRFIDWWWNKTRRHALVDPDRMMFTERWVDYVPSFFEHHILKHPGSSERLDGSRVERNPHLSGPRSPRCPPAPPDSPRPTARISHAARTIVPQTKTHHRVNRDIPIALAPSSWSSNGDIVTLVGGREGETGPFSVLQLNGDHQAVPFGESRFRQTHAVFLPMDDGWSTSRRNPGNMRFTFRPIRAPAKKSGSRPTEARNPRGPVAAGSSSIASVN